MTSDVPDTGGPPDPDDAAGARDTQRALRELEARYRKLVEQIPAITYTELTEGTGSVSAFISPQVERYLGYRPEEFPDLDTWGAIIHPDDRAAVLEAADRAEATGDPFVVEYRVFAKDGREVWLRDEATFVEGDGDRRFWQGVILDITVEKRAEEQLREAREQVEFLAYHDTLTGLPNRALFGEMLDKAFARARRQGLGIAVIFIDLDDFKVVNDSLGHDVGDELLRHVAERLMQAVRDTDLVARQGGDEFLILLSDLELDRDAHGMIGAESARALTDTLCGRIETLMQEPLETDSGQIFASCSFGISIFPVEALDARDLLRKADADMYAMKRSKQERADR